MKNLLTTRFINLGLGQKLNSLFVEKLADFDMDKLIPAQKAENPGDYLMNLGDCFLNLVYILADMDNAMIKYKKKNIPDDIILDSLNDVGVWVMNHYNSTGEIGFATIPWECAIHNVKVIKIGRLQYAHQACETASPAHGLKVGDNVIYMHIQEGPGLTPEACRESIARAKEFYRQYFPEFEYKYMVCHSWMLDPALPGMVKPDSNLAMFYKMFEVVETSPSQSAMKRVFGPDAQKPVEELPENSTLQKNMKAFLLGGGELSIGFGVLKA
ncbi:MAG: hypothetical protein E7588_07650 [Ruminococcaceae bacterium]|nr:hypothetical protein [Oscillospiraceae bacterium]